MMKMKRIYLFYFLVVHLISCNSQGLVEINFKRDCALYIINGSEKYFSSFTINNPSDDCLWFWFSKDTCNNLTDEEKIKNYFFKTNTPSENNLFQIATDRNIEVYIPAVYQSFITKIPAKQSFTIDVMQNETLTKKEKELLDEFINKRIFVYKEEYILKNFPRLNSLNEIVFYKMDRIILNYQDILVQ